MNNGDLPASPVDKESIPFLNQAAGVPAGYTAGLTKREHFAGLAMQGLIAGTDEKGECIYSQKGVVEGAVLFADALLAELERTK